MEICKQNFFVIKVSLPWKWYGTFDEILHYNSFSLPPFSTTDQTGLIVNRGLGILILEWIVIVAGIKNAMASLGA